LCRQKPDINSKVIQVFSKGTELKGKPTNIQFTFMGITDVWYEIPELKCHIFGGLLVPAGKKSAGSGDWRIEDQYFDGRNILMNTTIRSNRYGSKSECDMVIAEEGRAANAKQAANNRKSAQNEKYGKPWNENLPHELPIEGGFESKCIQN